MMGFFSMRSMNFSSSFIRDSKSSRRFFLGNVSVNNDSPWYWWWRLDQFVRSPYKNGDKAHPDKLHFLLAAMVDSLVTAEKGNFLIFRIATVCRSRMWKTQLIWMYQDHFFRRLGITEAVHSGKLLYVLVRLFSKGSFLEIFWKVILHLITSSNWTSPHNKLELRLSHTWSYF